MTLALGLLLALCAAACFDGAIALQAAEARKVDTDEELSPALLARLARRPRWLAAIGIDLLGWPFQLAALALVPLTIVQPALALGLILLLVLGDRMLGERPGRSELAGVALLVGGVAVLAAVGPEHTDKHAGTTALVAVSAGMGLIALLPFAFGPRGPLLVVAAGSAYTLAAIASKLLTDELSAGTAWAAIAWAAVAGLGALLGKLAESAALQRMAAAAAAAPIFAIQAVVPVLAAPLLTGEHWNAGVPVGLVLVLIGTLGLARSPAVLRLVEAAE